MQPFEEITPRKDTYQYGCLSTQPYLTTLSSALWNDGTQQDGNIHSSTRNPEGGLLTNKNAKKVAEAIKQVEAALPTC